MKTIKILIVEDQLILAKILARKLQKDGYEVFGIVDLGIKAIAKVAEMHPDLVLMDILLKGNMDGITTSQKIQVKYNVPIIYTISCSERNILKRARETNPKGYIVKPYDYADLKATIESALHSQKLILSNLKRVKEKTKLVTHKVKQIARENFNLPSISARERQVKRDGYQHCLPQLSSQDAQIVSSLWQQGVYLTSLAELGFP